MTKHKLTLSLSGLLALQLVVALVLTLHSQHPTKGNQGGPLIAANLQQVDKIEIQEPNKPAVDLVKKDGHWSLPGYFNLPVQTGKLDGLLAQLKGLQRNWPVADTDTTAKRFEVTADKYQRKLTLMDHGKAVTTLYLGTSPGYKRSHVRLDGEKDIYALGLNSYDLPSGNQDWVDNGLLELNGDQLTAIAGPDFQLNRNGDQWQLSGLGDQEMTDKDAVNRLLGGLSNLRFEEALGTDAKPEYGMDQPVLKLDLKRKSGGDLSYSFGKPQKGDYYVLKASDQQPYFKIPATLLEQLVNMKRESLAKHKPDQATGKASDQAEGKADTTQSKVEPGQSKQPELAQKTG